MSLTRRRLAAQRLTGAPFTDAASLVRAQGAVQSQDYPGAVWALAQRLPAGTTQAALDAAFDRGAFLRTHVLRPTWHFVAPEDIRWMLALTGPRILAGNAKRFRDLALDPKTLDRALRALPPAMVGGRSLTREEVRAALARARVDAADTERFTHVMMFAELQGLVCSGARHGKQTTTYALLDERAPAAPPRDRDDAVRELVRRYFASHGPATLHDFVVWSGLTIADARAGLEVLGDAFTSREIDGRRWWWSATAPPPPTARATVARLLPNYDEYFIGFKHREPILARLAAQRVTHDSRDLLAHVLMVDGQVVGGWKRVAGKRPALRLSPVVPLTPRERAALEREVARFGRFVENAVEIVWDETTVNC